MANTSSKGNCYLCGKTLGKTAMKNHIFKEHMGETGAQEATLFKIEGMYNKDFWLFLDVADTATLALLDAFLREIWLECCGHMSAFLMDYNEVSKGVKIGTLIPGTQFLYEYDFGSTTELLITVMGKVTRPKGKNAVRLLARNEAPVFPCSCGKPAEFICQECLFEGEEFDLFYCGKCMKEHGHDLYLPVTNSPRLGECAYDGALDTYAFVPLGNMEKGKSKAPGKRIKKS